MAPWHVAVDVAAQPTVVTAAPTSAAAATAAGTAHGGAPLARLRPLFTAFSSGPSNNVPSAAAAAAAVASPSRRRAAPAFKSWASSPAAAVVVAHMPAGSPVTAAAQRAELARPMYLPGRILHLVKTHVAAVDVASAACARALPRAPRLADALAALLCCCVRRTRAIYEPRWARRTAFGRIQVSTSAITEHLPNHAMDALRAAQQDAVAAWQPEAGVV